MYRLLPFSLCSSAVRGRKARKATAALIVREGTERVLGEHNGPLSLSLTVKLMIIEPRASLVA